MLYKVFNYDFIIYALFTHIAGSNTVNDGVTKWTKHKILKTK